MPRPTILITCPGYVAPAAREQFLQIGNLEIVEPNSPEFYTKIEHATVLYIRIETRIDATLLKQAPQLKLILTGTEGLNHIDTDACAKHGITIFSLGGEHAGATAEHALGLLFALARNHAPAREALLEGKWQREKFVGRELSGMTLGILGMGKIGAELAARANALSMRVIGFDPFLDARTMAARGAEKKETLEAFLPQADAVSLHCLLSDETAGLLGTKELALLKDGAFLVNAARAEVVDTHALLQEIATGRISAAIDVFTTEPPDKDDPLILAAKKYPNLLLTPHLGASTKEAIERSSLVLAKKAAAFFL